MKKLSIIIFLICFNHIHLFAQIGTYTKAKSELIELIISNKIRVDEKINATTFNYLIQIEKVELNYDTLIIVAKPTKYKVTLSGKAKILSEGEKAPTKTFKTSILNKFEDYYPKSVVLGNLSFNEATFEEGENLKKFADNIVILRENYSKEIEKNEKSKFLDSLLIDFEKKIQNNQNQKNNSEEIEKQRELMVQANLFFDQKQYNKVIINGDISDATYTVNGNGNVKINTLLNLTPSSSPTTPARGDVYYDNTSNKIRVWTGSSWENLN